MKYAIFDNLGFPKAFYDDEIHETIPKEAIQITEEQWLEFINNQGQRVWDFDTNTVKAYTPPLPTLEELRERKLQEIASARWKDETGGLTLPDGTVVKTDRESQSLLMGAALFAKEDPTYVVNWKGANGWVTLDASTILQLAAAVRQHVQSCFDKEKELTEKIMAATSIKELEAIKWE